VLPENVAAVGEILREYFMTAQMYNLLWEWMFCKVMYVPAVTVQPNRDLQQCVEQQFSLTFKDGE
jgi:hypothetical protein